jgi:hypothetical protein
VTAPVFRDADPTWGVDPENLEAPELALVRELDEAGELTEAEADALRAAEDAAQRTQTWEETGLSLVECILEAAA